MADDWVTLEDHIRKLLKEGKRSQDPEFQLWLSLPSHRQRVIDIVKKILNEGKPK